LKADMKKGEDVCARGAAAGCQGVITLGNELCMDTKPTLRAYIRIVDRVVTSEPERGSLTPA